MKNQSQLGSALKWLQRNFPKFKIDKEYIDYLCRLNITSLAYTTDGGFDLDSGEFHLEARPISYKVRLKYKVGKDCDKQKMIVLMGVSRDEKRFVQSPESLFPHVAKEQAFLSA
ncbi:MAG: hypothetical protein WBG71_02670 [Leeuwenhoekiella sp.]